MSAQGELAAEAGFGVRQLTSAVGLEPLPGPLSEVRARSAILAELGVTLMLVRDIEAVFLSAWRAVGCGVAVFCSRLLGA